MRAGRVHISSSFDELPEDLTAAVSAWVNDALRLKTEHDRRMRALDEFLTTYEVAHGEITEDEIRDAARRGRGRATVVRGARVGPHEPRRRSEAL